MTYLQVLSPLRLPFQKCIQHCTAWLSVGCIVPTHNIIRCSNPLEELWICVLPTAVVGDVGQVHVDRWTHRHRQTALRTIGSFGKQETRGYQNPSARDKQINTGGLGFQKDFSIAAVKLRLIQVLLLTGDLGAFLGQCCDRSWVGKEVLPFSGGRDWKALGSEAFFRGRGTKNLHY